MARARAKLRAAGLRKSRARARAVHRRRFSQPVRPARGPAMLGALRPGGCGTGPSPSAARGGPVEGARAPIERRPGEQRRPSLPARPTRCSLAAGARPRRRRQLLVAREKNISTRRGPKFGGGENIENLHSGRPISGGDNKTRPQAGEGKRQQSRNNTRPGQTVGSVVEYLHERHLNAQRLPVRRLDGDPNANRPANCQLVTTTRSSSATIGPPPASSRRRQASGNEDRPAGIKRLVRSSASSSVGTQTASLVRAPGSGPSMAAQVGPGRAPDRRDPEEIVAQPHGASSRQPTNRWSLNNNQNQNNQIAANQKRVNEMERIKARSKAHSWHWSESGKSHECLVTEDKLGLCFHPISSESAAACRAARPLKRNGSYYYWEILVKDKIYGTSVMFGLCTRRQEMHVRDYCNLVGQDDQGWSLTHKGLIWHNGQAVQYTNEFPTNQPITVGLLYDTMRGELSFFMDGKNLGVAFGGLNEIQEELYPVVASTAKCTQMRLIGSYCSCVSLLQRACFTLLERTTRDNKWALVEYLRRARLPRHLLEYVADAANLDSDEDEDCDEPGGGGLEKRLAARHRRTHKHQPGATD